MFIIPKFIDDVIKNTIGQIKYRESITTGEITVDNGDGTYAVKIAQAGIAIPSIPTAHYDDTFVVGEIAIITYEYGNKEMPRLWGHAKKIAQNPIEVEVDYSTTGGDPITTVTTLDAYSIAETTTYLEGRIALSGGVGNCTRRGFKYGLTTAYGSDTHEDGDYGEGAFALQILGLTAGETYHYQACILDANGDEQIGEDKTFITDTALSIDIGAAAINRAVGVGAGYTNIAKENPANASGKITSIEIWAYSNITGLIVAIFTQGAANVFTARDSQIIGNVTADSKQIFEVDLDVQEGDFIGVYQTSGSIELDTSGEGYWRIAGNQTACNEVTFPFTANRTISLYGTNV